MRKKIHKKYIQIIGHRKTKIMGVIILGLLGAIFIFLYFWRLKTQYNTSRLDVKLKAPTDGIYVNELDTTQENFVKGVHNKK